MFFRAYEHLGADDWRPIPETEGATQEDAASLALAFALASLPTDAHAPFLARVTVAAEA